MTAGIPILACWFLQANNNSKQFKLAIYLLTILIGLLGGILGAVGVEIIY